MSGRFTIRVYGLLVDEGRVLVSDEIIRGRPITKFPGGGMEFGEGPLDALIREIREEMGLNALDLQHYYTTDLFQQSTFHTTPMQVMSLYYTFRTANTDALAAVIDGDGRKAESDSDEVFRWLRLKEARAEDLSLPIDRIVMRMLLADHAGHVPIRLRT